MLNDSGSLTPQHSGIRTPMGTESLISTIRRHLTLVREDPEFVNYAINLALYLLEVNGGQIPIEEIPEPRIGENATLTVDSRKRLEGAAPIDKNCTCRLCGAPTQGKRMCPSCGHMVG